MDWLVRTAIRSSIVAMCLWVAARLAVDGSKVLAISLGLPADDVLLVTVLGATLLTVIAWEPKRNNRSGGRRSTRYRR